MSGRLRQVLLYMYDLAFSLTVRGHTCWSSVLSDDPDRQHNILQNLFCEDSRTRSSRLIHSEAAKKKAVPPHPNPYPLP